VLAKPGKRYAVYVPETSPDDENVSLNILAGAYSVHWYDPTEGGALQTGSVAHVAGDGAVSIGAPPPGPDGKDWVALVRAKDGE